MNEALRQLIAIEEGMERLYRLFAAKFPEHHAFFAKIADEERRHASILKEIQGFPAMEVEQMINAFSQRVDEFEQVNQIIEREHKCFAELPKTVFEALELAYKLEESAGELHYQYVVMTETESRVLAKIRELTGDDKDHAQRLRTYAQLQDQRHGHRG